MFRSAVWDQIHCGMDTICLHRTGSNLSSILPYGITFISGPIWYQRADLIHTGSTWSYVNIRLTNTNFILVPKGSSPCKCCLNLWPLGILATLNSRFFFIAFLGIFVSKLTFYAFCLYHFSIICGLIKPPLLYFCNSSVAGVSFHLLLLCLFCLDISGRRNHY